MLSFKSGRFNFTLYLPLRITTLIDAVRFVVIHLFMYAPWRFWAFLRYRKYIVKLFLGYLVGLSYCRGGTELIPLIPSGPRW